MSLSKRLHVTACSVLVQLFAAQQVVALDGGTLRVNTHNDWKAFEIISISQNPTDDGFNWTMPGTFDGLAPGFRTLAICEYWSTTRSVTPRSVK